MRIGITSHSLFPHSMFSFEMANAHNQGMRLMVLKDGIILAFRILLGTSSTATALKSTKLQVRGTQERCFPRYLSSSA